VFTDEVALRQCGSGWMTRNWRWKSLKNFADSQARGLAFGEALKNQRSLRFPGTSIGPKHFLQMVEDLFWLLTRKTVGYGRLFVHHLHRTVFRISPRLYYLPQSCPWLGDFDARNRLGLLSHTAALAGGRSIREQLLLASARRYYGVTEALTWLCSSDRSNLRQRLEAWPQIQRNTVFSAD
jgi:hypothetical protein